MTRILSTLRGGLIVSCQAGEGEPLNRPDMLAAMAASAEVGGAKGIRAEGVDNIAKIRQRTDLPIIALIKRSYEGSDVYITPTFADAKRCAEAGGDVIAIDGTGRPRPGGEDLAELIDRIQTELKLPVMADVSTVEEGVIAAKYGASAVGTTLAGYTPYSTQQTEPDFAVLRELAEVCSVAVIAEGRIATPEQAREAISLGAFAVVVGTAITAPIAITKRFVEQLPPVKV